jgi:transposase
MAMVVQCPDDLVGIQHSVRLVMAVVEKLDVSRFCEPIKAREGFAGRDATDPRLLVALWLYASIRGIGSARELARRCEESAPFRWLCGGVTVNHRLLSDFRTDHADALDELFTQVIASLVDKEVVQVSRIRQDGVRVRVNAGASSFRREGAGCGVATAGGFAGVRAVDGSAEGGAPARRGRETAPSRAGD